ncbi:DUF3829 domain-containing protein [Acinetobacter qingfengensis]|nr:DUF3829 domain-containing protein [Acinetobacter qingfengensis]
MSKIFLSAMICSVLLAGCDEKKQADHETSENTAPADTVRINDHIAIANQLTGLSGVEQAQAQYLKQKIATATPDKAIDYPSLNYKYLNEKFSALKDVSSLSPALQTASKDLKVKIHALEQDYNEFNIYYDSGEYKTDQLAKGKKADAQIQQHFKEAVDSFQRFQIALNEVYSKEKKKELEKLKESGNAYAYHRAAALDASERLVSVFQTEQDITNPAKYKEADAIADQLQQELNQLNTEYNKNKEKDPKIATDTVLMSLSSCLKYYREFKQSKNQYDFKFMIDAYNSAVQYSNFRS